MERVNQLMGFEESMIAMLEEPEAYTELVEAIADFKIAVVDKVVEYYKPDSILTMDDLGTARGPLISAGMYRDVVKNSDTRICQAIREKGVFLHFHSCGAIDAFLEDIMDFEPHLLCPYQGGINSQPPPRKNTAIAWFLRVALRTASAAPWPRGRSSPRRSGGPWIFFFPRKTWWSTTAYLPPITESLS